MKTKSIIFFLCTIAFSNDMFLYSAMAPAPRPNAANNAAQKPAMPDFNMSDEDMKMITELIDSLDEEQIDFLTALGEGIIKEAEELGMDPFDYLDMQTEELKELEKPIKPTPPQPGKPLEPEKKSTPIADVNTIEMLKNLIRLIGDIRQKAAHDKEYANQLIPFKYRLDDLIYYLNLLTNEKLTKYLAEKEFEPLLANLKQLHTHLAELEPQLNIAEFSLEGKNLYEILDLPRTATQDDIVQAYQQKIAATNPQTLEVRLIRQGKEKTEIDKALAEVNTKFAAINEAYTELRNQEESNYIFDQILAALTEATDKQLILEEIKKLFKKHEPEALKVQQEREKVEADARKLQEDALRKRAAPGRMVFSMPPPQPSYSTYEPSVPGGDYFGGPSFGGESLTPPPSAGIKARGGGEKGAGKAGGVKKDGGKKKKKKKKEEAENAAEKGKGGAEKLPSKVNAQVAIIKDRIKEFSKKIEDKKDLLGWKFKELITTPMPKPYDEDALKKIAELKNFINELSAILLPIPRKIKDGIKEFKDDKANLATYKKVVGQEFENFEKQKQKKPGQSTPYQLIEPLLKFDEKLLLQPKLEATPLPVDRAKVFVLTGAVPVGTVLNVDDATDVEAQKLSQLNPKEEIDVEVPDPTTPGKTKTVKEPRRKNYLQLLKNAYEEAKDQIDEEKKKKS